MQTHRSPGILKTLTELEGLEKPKILDLGPTSTEMLSYFSGRSCKLYFEDLPSLLFGRDKNSDEAGIEKLVEQHMFDYGVTRFDLVLCWDLLNYLELSTIHKLMEKINQHCQPNTLFHIIRYSGRELPCRPRRFKLATGGNLHYEETPLQQRSIANHSTVRLLQHMKDLFMEDTMINDPGMQSGFVEHILRYKPTEHQHRVSSVGKVVTTPQITAAQKEIKNQNTSPSTLSAGHHHTYFSPGVEQIINHLAKQECAKLLVFSARQGHQFDGLLNIAHDIYVEDIFNSLQWQNTQPNSANQDSGRVYFHYPPDTKFDAIFVWDLFNYCESKEISIIGQLLAKHCTSSTRIYLLSYTHEEIPARSCQFSLTSDNRIAIPKSTKTTSRRHNLTSTSLMKLLPNFYVTKTHTYRPDMIMGTCEYVFEYREDISSAVIEQAAALKTKAYQHQHH